MNNTKKLDPVMDLDYDLSCAFHTPEILEKKIRMLADHGFERLHIVAPPPGGPDYSHAARVLAEDGPPNFLRQSRETFSSDPLKQAVKFAKDAGLEVIIVFKPYEGGGVFTIPHNTEPPCNRNYLETLGGRAVGLDPFIVEHPEFLLERKPYDDFRSKTVTKIELLFILDKIDDSDEIKQASFGEDVSSKFPAEIFQICISSDNGKYELYNGSYDITEYIEFRALKNANGESVFPKPVRCRIIEISGLEINSSYFSVEFNGENKAFRTIPFSMFTVFSVDGELPVTVSPTLRHDEPFKEIGFEFEELGPYYWDCGWRACTRFGFARGKLQRLSGSLCEAYPEVRRYWLEQINDFIDMGADGIEIRLQSHCSGVTDFVNYGFNPPLIDAYRERYGCNILTQTVDPVKMMKIRGKFFEIFLKDAAEVLHGNKVNLLIHLHGYMERPSLIPTFHEMGFWANPKILPDWRKLVEIADEIVIKDYNFGVYRREEANGIKDLAVKFATPVWIHCYLQQGNDWNKDFLKAVDNDPRISGLQLYEVVWNAREDNGIIKVDKMGNTSWMLPDNIYNQ